MWFKYSRAVYNRSHDRAVSKGSPGRKFTSLTSKSPDEELTCYAPRDLVVNASPSPERWLPAIRKIVASADPQQPVSNIRTMNEIVAGQTESRTIQLRVLISLYRSRDPAGRRGHLWAALVCGVFAAAGIWNSHCARRPAGRHLQDGVETGCHYRYGRPVARCGAGLFLSQGGAGFAGRDQA